MCPNYGFCEVTSLNGTKKSLKVWNLGSFRLNSKRVIGIFFQVEILGFLDDNAFNDLFGYAISTDGLSLGVLLALLNRPRSGWFEW